MLKVLYLLQLTRFLGLEISHSKKQKKLKVGRKKCENGIPPGGDKR